jgi:hypothetical protein
VLSAIRTRDDCLQQRGGYGHADQSDQVVHAEKKEKRKAKKKNAEEKAEEKQDIQESRDDRAPTAAPAKRRTWLACSRTLTLPVKRA